MLQSHRAKKATKADARRFIDQSFTDAISWKAARTLLRRVVLEAQDNKPLSADLLAAIHRFLERHPESR